MQTVTGTSRGGSPAEADKSAAELLDGAADLIAEWGLYPGGFFAATTDDAIWRRQRLDVAAAVGVQLGYATWADITRHVVGDVRPHAAVCALLTRLRFDTAGELARWCDERARGGQEYQVVDALRGASSAERAAEWSAVAS